MGRNAWVLGVLCCMGIATWVMIPNLLRSTCEGGNETAAIASLRNLAAVQGQFQERRVCDLDGDKVGEFGTLAELTGADGIRMDPTGRTRTAPLGIALLSTSLAGTGDAGLAFKSGYAYRVFLPGAGGGAVHEGPATPLRDVHRTRPGGTRSPGPLLSGPVDVDASERHWCAYAWPVAHGNSGLRAFFTDPRGDVWWTANGKGRYSGPLAPPAWDAALPADGRPGWSTAPNVRSYTGRDGNLWVRTL